MSPPFPPAQIRIRRLALAKLLLYAECCPVEIGGLGYAVRDEKGLLIPDLFILPQRVSISDTELNPDGLFACLGNLVAASADVASLRVWWHSHGDLGVQWSETDWATIENLPGEFWVALLVNRQGEVRCRLDVFSPRRETWELPLEVVEGEAGTSLEALRPGVEREICEQVTICPAGQEEAARESGVSGRESKEATVGSEAG